MSRSCTTCQHLKRPDIDRRLAAGEPVAQVARAYELNLSSLHRHRRNCLKLGSSNAIKAEAARGSAAAALLPSKEALSGAYFELRERIDQIARQAQAEGSLKTALAGLSSIRHTLDSLARLAGHDRGAATEINVAVQTNVQVTVNQIAERLIRQFDHDPELKGRVAQALLSIDAEQSAAIQPVRELEELVAHQPASVPPIATGGQATAAGEPPIPAAAHSPAKQQQSSAANQTGRPDQTGSGLQPVGAPQAGGGAS